MNKNKGFSLVELMVVLAILAMIMAYAIPNYRDYVVKSKRAEAHNKLLEIAGMFEKFYVNNNRYPTSLRSGGAFPLGMNNTYLTWADYTITATFTANGWTLTATAQNAQATDDSSCATITYNNQGQKGTSAECWNE